MILRVVFGILIIAGQIYLYSVFLRRADISTSDWPTYYSVGRIFNRGENPYSLEAQCAEMAKIIGDKCFPLAHPPLLLPVLSVISEETFNNSLWHWLGVLACVLIACFGFLVLLTENIFGSAQVLIFYPTVLSIFFANDTVFVLLGVSAWAYLLLYRDGDFMEREWLAGAALSLTCLKPQLAIILALPLLFAKPKVFLGFCIGGLFWILLGLKMVGVEGFKGIIDITRIMASGQGYGIGQEYMVNTTGWLVRAGLSPFWAWPLYCAAIIGLCVLWKRKGASAATVSLSLIAAVFFAPHVHNYDLALLAIPLVFAHRLAPLMASLIMILAIPLHAGFVGALLLILPMSILYLKRTITRPTEY